MFNSAEQQIAYDARVREAAQAFWKSREWAAMYLRGFVPSEHDFPEYYRLRDALVEGIEPTWRPVHPMSWRIRLARWIAGF